MKIITYGDIMDSGKSVFTSVAMVDGSKLKVSFKGEIRIDNPYKYLASYLNDLNSSLGELGIDDAELDFTLLRFCNSNGFYVIMDITEAIYTYTHGVVRVRRLAEDDWQQETLPILIDIDEAPIFERTHFIDVDL